VAGVAAMLVASGITTPPGAEGDLLGAAFEAIKPSSLTAEQIRSALQDAASALEGPALTLRHAALVRRATH
jgi:hypothetical protein